MPSTSMNISMDSDIKNQAEQLFSELGMNMTTAVNIFLRQSVRQQRIPFELKLDVPNAETRAAMEEAERLIKNGKGKQYSSAKELF